MNTDLPANLSRKDLEGEIEYISGLTAEQTAGQEHRYAERLARLLGEWYSRLSQNEKRLLLRTIMKR